MGRIVLFGALFALLAGACYMALTAWLSFGDVDLGTAGTTFLTLGIVLSLVVGCGLMALVFYSSRRGFDDRVHYDDEEPLP